MILKPSFIEQGQMLFTQDEFNNELTLAKAEMMTIAIHTTKQALHIEREECAKLADEAGQAELAESIRNRLTKK